MQINNRIEYLVRISDTDISSVQCYLDEEFDKHPSDWGHQLEFIIKTLKINI